jgi:diguanylate cyclase (GGDEF)-like protein
MPPSASPPEPQMTAIATDETWRQELTPAGLTALGARNECDREPIERSGAIQPHGFLLALDPTDQRIMAASANLAEWTGCAPELALDQGLETVLGVDLAALVGALAMQPDIDEINPVPISLPAQDDGRRLEHFEMVLHRGHPWLMLEVEPAFVLSDQGLIGFYQTLGRTMDRLHEVDEVAALCRLAVHDLRELTGYDRVMVYRFDADAHGSVIAEEHAPAQEPYLGLHYPAGDIPRQARILYFRNRLRLIANVDYRPVPLLVAPSLAGPEALDLSLSVLRSVSPVHLDYLRNMGVAATMTVSLVIDDRLWGLLACHHGTPKRISARIRMASEMIGQLLALQIRAAETREQHAYEARLARLVAQTVAAMAAGESLPAGARGAPEALLGMLGADGAVVQVGGERAVLGETPSAPTIDRLIPRIAALALVQAPPLVTAALSAALENGGAGEPDLARLAAGAVYLPVGHRDGDFILWLRREQSETVRWAGAVDAEGRRAAPDATGQLTPRGSFDEWRETVRGRSRSWHPAEIAAARELAQALPELLLHRAQHRLLRLAMHDPLTGLPNRALLLERMRETQEADTPMAAIFVDLDRFKEINDTYGHQAGDTLLIEAAHRLQAAVRPGDTVARLGGDEFVVLVQGLGVPEQAAAVAGRIVQGFQAPFALGPQIQCRVTASVGVTIPRGPAEPVEILHQADTALYRAKRAGRDRVAIYDPDWSVLGAPTEGLESEIRRAIAEGELVVHFQPVFDLAGPVGASPRADRDPPGQVPEGCRLRGVEALVRWQHPKRGLLGADALIPVAEETGLIEGIWDFVLGETLRQLACWQHPDLQGAVNVSAGQLGHPEFVARTLERLAQAGIAPTRLCIEVTETQVMERPEQAAAVLAELTQAGIVIAIDDFGIGFSSLAYARNLPAGILKIDRSFVAGLPDNPRDLALVSSAVRLAHELKMIAVGEGVETQAQLDCLRELGCDSVQGYLLGRPAAADRLDALAAPRGGADVS